MPIVDISLLAGRSAEDKQAIADAVHDAMVETLGLPEDDYFVLFHEHAPDAFYSIAASTASSAPTTR
jgi:4-oxalocrotonate tautomerase family enzyme